MTISVSDCRSVVGAYYGIPKSVMLSKRRKRKIARPRQMAMTLAREFTGKSYPFIGQSFGGLDHTTVLHAERRIHELEGWHEGVREVMGQFRITLALRHILEVPSCPKPMFGSLTQTTISADGSSTANKSGPCAASQLLEAQVGVAII